MAKFIDRIQSDSIILFDGPMGTEIHARNPSDADYKGLLGCSEILNETLPHTIQAIHESYLRAGSDVIETNSFGSNAIVLAEYGISDRAREISRLSAEIAQRACEKFRDKQHYIAGSVGPGTKLISLNQAEWTVMYSSYREQIGGLLEGGVHGLIIETCQDPLQIKCAVIAAQDEMTAQQRFVPIMVSFTIETTGTLLVGTDLSAVCTSILPLGIDTLGMNCATGPEEMIPYISQLSDISPLPISVQPNAGLPQNVNGEMLYTLSKEDFLRFMLSFVQESSVRIAGGCCGVTPEFIAALHASLRDIDIGLNAPSGAASSENTESDYTSPPTNISTNTAANTVPTPEKAPEAVASLYISQNLTQDNSPFFIGERTNTNGSKKFREHLLEENWDALVDIAREQAESGIHALDLCVAYTGRDEVQDMRRVLMRMRGQITLPIVVDSTELNVLETALQLYGGRAIINSINLEDGEKRADAVCRLARRYGAALIALTIDEGGMAKASDQKLAVAQRIYDIAVKRHGMRAGDLIFDPLTFTLGSGDESMIDSAEHTLEGIRRIKGEIAGVRTVLGLSNVSFGLSANSRRVLNSVFLQEAVEAGLDMAIVNLRHIIPLASLSDADIRVSQNLIHNVLDTSEQAPAGDTPLFQFISHFGSQSEQNATASTESEDLLPIEEQIQRRIITGSRGGMEEKLMQALEQNSAVDIINTILIPAMKIVGDLFGEGKMQLPFVLQSAEVMKFSVSVLEPFMERVDSEKQVSMVLATVRGDVHDIGKNLVDIILSNNGYKIYNLGIKCEIDTMIKKAQEVNADVMCMSGLLVKSTVIMRENLIEMQRRGMRLPVLLGGAALTPSYVMEDCNAVYDPPVLYCHDAFENLKIMNSIKDGTFNEYLRAKLPQKAVQAQGSPAMAQTSNTKGQSADTSAKDKTANSTAKKHPTKPKAKPPRSANAHPKQPVENIVIDRSVNIPEAPFWGVRSAENINLSHVYPLLTEEVLFRGRWGYRRGKLSKPEYEELIEGTVRPEFERLKEEARSIFTPKIVYGYFPCNSSANELILYDPDSGAECARFTFPRQAQPPAQCIADYFLPLESGKSDVIVLQVVTIGMEAHAYNKKLYENAEYKDYLLFHGLGVETAEALAEYWHLKVREELRITEEDGGGIDDFVIQKYRGSRYSFGYPACPDLAQNRILCNLLNSEQIGVIVSEEDQMVPEQTTSAFIVHHPQAKYFNT